MDVNAAYVAYYDARAAADYAKTRAYQHTGTLTDWYAALEVREAARDAWYSEFASATAPRPSPVGQTVDAREGVKVDA